MPWREPGSVPFTRIGIVSNVPPEAGVFGVMHGQVCLYLGDTWNLRARLLELANAIPHTEGLTLVWERCPEPDCATRRNALEQELAVGTSPELPDRFPGLHLRP